jgi:cardiolipin synthase (CMP-forming)
VAWWATRFGHVRRGGRGATPSDAGDVQPPDVRPSRPGCDTARMVRMFDAGLQADRPVVVHDRVWTVANAITFVRLAGLPLFVYLVLGSGAYGMAFLTLALVAATDWVDGYVARRFDQVTKLGQVLDPLIDRALLATAGITLAVVGALPWWVLAAVVLRDALVLGLAYAWFGGNPGIPVNRLGKLSTACLLIGVPGFLLGFMDWGGATFWGALGWAFTAVGLVTYYAAGAMYFRAARQTLATRLPDALVAQPATQSETTQSETTQSETDQAPPTGAPE